MVEVRQEDRDAVADYLFEHGGDWGFCGDVREGRIDHPLTNLLAAHAANTRAKVIEECADWLRERCFSLVDIDSMVDDLTEASKLGEQP